MHQHILKFIEHQRVAGICCLDEEGHPYCFSAFYAWDEEDHLLIFKSATTTTHARLLMQNPVVAGTIQPDKLNPALVKGLQFSGRLLQAEPAQLKAKKIYHKRFLFSSVIPGEIWCIQLEKVKMTDQSLGFGKKLEWEGAKALL